jgi:mannose-6-phosphate isomerase
MLHDLSEERAWARGWLFGAALPLWWEKGADRVDGGWFDKLDQQGVPVDCPKRLRVQARQAFVYAEAGRLGWEGPWREAAIHGIDFMLSAFRRADGLFRASVTRGGAPVVEAPDLYDQAFALFALASGYAVLDKPPALLAEAEALLGRIETLLPHPELGFEEANPRRLPLRSNPHMHMLEALLAWVEAGGGTVFERHACAIVALAREKLIDPRTGAIGEYYDGCWSSAIVDGHLREPGHQFEWAYLLDFAGRVLGGDHIEACTKLYRFGDCHGVMDGRVIFSVGEDGAMVDGSSRLWAQTERLRATLMLVPPGMGKAENDEAVAAAINSLATLRRFLDVPITGLWIDRIDANSIRLWEPAPASSFYHIVTGLVPLIEEVERRSAAQPQSIMQLAGDGR